MPAFPYMCNGPCILACWAITLSTKVTLLFSSPRPFPLPPPLPIPNSRPKQSCLTSSHSTQETATNRCFTSPCFLYHPPPPAPVNRIQTSIPRAISSITLLAFVCYCRLPLLSPSSNTHANSTGTKFPVCRLLRQLLSRARAVDGGQAGEWAIGCICTINTVAVFLPISGWADGRQELYPVPSCIFLFLSVCASPRERHRRSFFIFCAEAHIR